MGKEAARNALILLLIIIIIIFFWYQFGLEKNRKEK